MNTYQGLQYDLKFLTLHCIENKIHSHQRYVKEQKFKKADIIFARFSEGGYYEARGGGSHMRVSDVAAECDS